MHHICPKAHDLFPKYKSFTINPWNKIYLTSREHYIAHWMLWKVYGGSQTYSFFSMAKQKSKYQEKRYFNARAYSLVREEVRKLSSNTNSGFACYVDYKGNKIRCRTDDLRVSSGELVAQSKGRKYKSRTKEQRENTSKALRESEYNVNRKLDNATKIDLYKGDQKISVGKYSDYTNYIKDGWSTSCTKKYKSKIATENNKKQIWTEERRRKISAKQRGKKRTEQQITAMRFNLRKQKNAHKHVVLFYNNITKEFIEQDIILAEKNPDLTQVFCKICTQSPSGRRVYDDKGSFRILNPYLETPLPDISLKINTIYVHDT